jgi:hypothetical protein
LRLQVLVVGLEGYAAEVVGLEGAGELEELGLGIDTRSVDGGGEPGIADLNGEVLEVEVDEAGGADNFVWGAGMMDFKIVAQGIPVLAASSLRAPSTQRRRSAVS